MTLVRLPHSNKHVKRFIRRMEAYHSYKVHLAFLDYYESEYSRVCAKGREEVLLESEKRLGKLSKKASKNIK